MLSSTWLVKRWAWIRCSAWATSAELGWAPGPHHFRNCHGRWETAEKMCLRRRIRRRRPSPWMCGSLSPGRFWRGSSWSPWTRRQDSWASSHRTSLPRSLPRKTHNVDTRDRFRSVVRAWCLRTTVRQTSGSHNRQTQRTGLMFDAHVNSSFPRSAERG